ncbi:MAG TPA: hypothetical protein VGG02_01110 [Chthoniobacterales bacterium]|jgi:hypothetical protein
MHRLFFTLLLASVAAPLAMAGAPTIQVVTAIDYPHGNPTATNLFGIANNGVSVGIASFANGTADSFERSARGKYSKLFSFPGSTQTYGEAINNSGVVCGTFISGGDHGFFYDGTNFTQYDIPGSTYTFLTGENDAGDFTGVYSGNGVIAGGFVNMGGTVTYITIPGVKMVQPSSVNNLEQIAGFYIDPNHVSDAHGFFRDADGTLTYPIDYPGAIVTEITAVNDAGMMVGSWHGSDDADHGFYLKLPNHFVTYDYPGASHTYFQGFNNAGLITGSYEVDGVYHAFLARVRN